MINYDEDTGYQQPFYTIKGRNYLRIFLMVVLILVATGSFTLVYYTNYFVAALGLYSLFMILLIKFPTINLYHGHFEVIRKSLYYGFSEKEVYRYQDIRNIRFSPGYTNWTMVFFSAISGGKSPDMDSSERYSKSDSIILTLKENEKIEINRIGSKDNFAQTAELIKKQVLSLFASQTK